MGTKHDSYERLIAFVNRKRWWHVPPRDPTAYSKRGKFLASSFREAEFWGRPLDEPQRVVVNRPLIGDEDTVEKELFGRRVSDEGISMHARWRLDAKMKRAALARGHDSIVLMAKHAFARFRSVGEIPRSLELNVLRAPRQTPLKERKFFHRLVEKDPNFVLDFGQRSV